MSSDDTDSVVVKVAVSAVVVVLAIPGLVIEPGPISELVALSALGAIWGLDVLEDNDA